tara:strand:+ start:20687 stop:21208 length:522 start_codon:yes stop_codon:yes gene_type:complete
MFRRIIYLLLITSAVLSTAVEAQAARRYRSSRSRSSASARYQQAIRARQQQMLNYQKLMLQRQQALAKQRAEDLARKRQLSQVQQKHEAEHRQKQAEAVKDLRAAHDAKDKAAGIKHGSPEEVFKNYDKDGDGYLSAKEVAGSPTSMRFRELDSNSDGKLTLEELRAGDKPPR